MQDRKGRFSQVSVDLALEQTLNKDTKTSEGIIGFSQQPGIVRRWIQAARYRAELLQQAFSMAGMLSTVESKHPKEMGKVRLKRDEEDARNIVYQILDSVNPFELTGVSSLVNLKSGKVVPPDVEMDLLQAYEIGEEAMNKFVEKINSGTGFFESLKCKKLQTFASPKQKKKVM